MRAMRTSTPTIGRMMRRFDDFGGSGVSTGRICFSETSCCIAVAMARSGFERIRTGEAALSKLCYRAFGVSERHARYLQRGQYIDVLTTSRVQCQRGVDDIGVAGDTGAKTLSRLIDFLLGQAQALAGCADRLSRRREIEQC